MNLAIRTIACILCVNKCRTMPRKKSLVSSEVVNIRVLQICWNILGYKYILYEAGERFPHYTCQQVIFSFLKGCDVHLKIGCQKNISSFKIFALKRNVGKWTRFLVFRFRLCSNNLSFAYKFFSSQLLTRYLFVI